MKTYYVYKKVNYQNENQDKKQQIDKAISIIKAKAKESGLKEIKSLKKDVDYVFAVGGDGTMLSAMRTYNSKKTKIIGINTGNIGFLTIYKIEDLQNNLNLNTFLLQQKVEKCHVLSFNIGNKKGIAINECVLTATDVDKKVEFEIILEKNKKQISAGIYKADALVLSGPCGTSAYNKNLGGSIFNFNLKCIQLNFLASNSLSTRPIIVDDKTIIYIRPISDGKFFHDGRYQCHIKKENNMLLKIGINNNKSNILLPIDWNYFSHLSNKIKWNNS